jgi:hypothetical protein
MRTVLAHRFFSSERGVFIQGIFLRNIGRATWELIRRASA